MDAIPEVGALIDAAVALVQTHGIEVVIGAVSWHLILMWRKAAKKKAK